MAQKNTIFQQASGSGWSYTWNLPADSTLKFLHYDVDSDILVEVDYGSGYQTKIPGSNNWNWNPANFYIPGKNGGTLRIQNPTTYDRTMKFNAVFLK